MLRLAKAALLTIFVAVPLAAHAEPVAYTLDKSHTSITFDVDHFGFSTVHGRFPDFDGTITLDQQKPENSKVAFTVKAASIDTQWDKRDEHLRSDAFFNVAKFPDITFTSTKVVVDKKDKNAAEVTGNLTLIGVTKPVTFHVKLRKLEKSPITQKMTAGLEVEGKIKRTDFGMSAYAPMVGDEIPLRIDTEAFIN
ncbi:Polyisoprenoid-binding protein YceI [Arboricoccus pini]|uniref:Polyisoprenoid-binding protein YceI n=1 Tax=Arboricoccus pini TaxID=1963835 RepID=A0A212R6A8_9PROT|nr:YceI family protein [Arboricoccus pini]SNB67721.1 Polyisoprenoid-binding protein YceI [Arboricoccus pini]